MKRIALLGVALIALVSCGNGSDESADPPATAAPDLTAVPGATVAPTPPAEPPPVEGRTVQVYWTRDTQLAVGGRTVAPPSVAANALQQLLAGPNELEAGLGMVSAMPVGTEVLGLTIADGLATVDFNAAFEALGMGTAGEAALVSQVVFTLTQFPTVDRVDIRIEGEVRDAILSHGLEATGLTREGFYDAVAPAIVVERPYPGKTVAPLFSVVGFSRTFEANVVYEVRTADGAEVLAHGFTTAVQPDIDRFGPFAFDVDLGQLSGIDVLLRVFEQSAKDGSDVNVYEVPLRLQG